MFIKAYIQGRGDDPEYLIKCLIEHLENNIKKAVGDEPLDTDLISGRTRVKRMSSFSPSDSPKTPSNIKRVQERNKKLKDKEFDEYKDLVERKRKTLPPKTAVITYDGEQFVGSRNLKDKKALETLLALTKLLGEDKFQEYKKKLPIKLPYTNEKTGSSNITITADNLQNKGSSLWALFDVAGKDAVARVSRYRMAENRPKELTGTDLIDSMRGKEYGKYNPKTRTFFDAKMTDAEADKLIAELEEDQKEVKTKPKKIKNADILRVLSSDTGANYQVKQLQKILRGQFEDSKGKKIPTDKYLNRLNEVAIRYNQPESEDADKYLKDYLENNPKGIAATKEVFEFIITTLQKLQNSSEDASIKTAINKILVALRKKKERVIASMQRYSDSRSSEQSSEPTMYSSSQVLPKINKTTKTFWSKLSKDVESLPSALNKVKGDTAEISSVINDKLLYRGPEFTMTILDVIDKEVGIKGLKEQVVPKLKPFELSSPRSVPEWMKGRKTSVSGATAQEVQDKRFLQGKKTKVPSYREQGKKNEEERRRKLREKLNKLKKAEDEFVKIIPAYYYFDITMEGNKFGIKYRQVPYSEDSEGIKGIDSIVSKIKENMNEKIGKDTILSLAKRYVDVSLGKVTSRKSDKKAIQAYMEKEFKKIQRDLNEKTRLPNIPKRHIRKVKKLAKENYINIDRAFNVFASVKADGSRKSRNPLMGADGESNLNRILFGKLEDFKIDKVDTASLDKLVENIVMANVEETMTEEKIGEFVKEAAKNLEETVQSIDSKMQELKNITGQLDSESFLSDIKKLIVLAEKIEKSESKLKQAYELLDEQIETVEAEKDMAPSQKTPKTDEILVGQSTKTKSAFSTMGLIGRIQDELFDSIEDVVDNELLSGFWGKYEEVFNALKNPKSGLSTDDWLAKVNQFKNNRKGFYKLFEIDVDSLEDIKLNTEKIVREIEELQDSIANGGTYVVDKQLEEIETMILSAVALAKVKQIAGNESNLQQEFLDAFKKITGFYALSSLQGQRIGGKEWLRIKARPQKSRLQSEKLSPSDYAKYLSKKYTQFDVSYTQILEFLENKDSVKDKLEENKKSKEED